jgi:hypothetical protein
VVLLVLSRVERVLFRHVAESERRGGMGVPTCRERVNVPGDTVSTSTPTPSRDLPFLDEATPTWKAKQKKHVVENS